MNTFAFTASRRRASKKKRRRSDRIRSVEIAIGILGLLMCQFVQAFESDVHFGLTQWLALQAGYTAPQAQAIAIGDNRVDSGDMQYVNPLFNYACVGIDDDHARIVSQLHYPTAGPIPGAPEERSVIAGSDAAYHASREVRKAPPTQAGLRLYLFGEALHILQDSWSHQGVSETPQLDRAFACDPSHAWGHPRIRGGWNSHKADHTRDWPADTLAMAKATYDSLTSYPPIMEVVRMPKSWEQIRPAIDGFVNAATKTDKKSWFVAQGITDVSFLGDTTLKDGAERFDVRWSDRRLPALTSMRSQQHGVPADVLDYFSRFFVDWMSSDDLDRVAAQYGAANAKPAEPNAFVPMDKRELAARLKLWRMRDHGAAADLAHLSQRLTSKQIGAATALTKRADAYARYKTPFDAFFPMVTFGNDPSPLLPFLVAESKAAGGQMRMVATAKLRHAPYDVIAVVAENIEGQWRIMAIEAAVDH
jgi:hypothetical protein